MKHLAMRTKLGIGFGTILVLVCILGYMGYAALSKAATDTNTIVEQYNVMSDTTAGMLDIFRQLRAGVVTYESLEREADLKELRSHIAQFGERYAQAAAFAAANPQHTLFVQALKEIDTGFAAYRQGIEASIAQLQSNQATTREMEASALKAEQSIAVLLDTMLSVHSNLLQAEKYQLLPLVADNLGKTGMLMARFKDVRRAYAIAFATNDADIKPTTDQLFKEIEDLFTVMYGNLQTEKGRATAKSANEALNAYRQSLNSVYTAWLSVRRIGLERVKIGDTLSRVIETTNDRLNSMTAEFGDVIVDQTHEATSRILTLTGVMVLIGVALSVLLTRAITGPLLKSVRFAQAVAAGNLKETLEVQQRDEVGRLADALRAIPEVFGSIVEEYAGIERRIAAGQLDAKGDAARYSGEFAGLINGTNAVLERFLTLVEHIPSSVILLDKHLKAAYLNHTARLLAGENYRGKTCGELFHRADDDTPADGLRIAVQTHKPAGGETVAHPGGKTLDVDYRVIPMLDAKGELASVLQFVNDITDIKKAQRTILHVADEAVGISGRVATAAEELSAQVEQSERGASVTSERITETATAMEEMNATVLAVARNAGSAASVSTDAKAKAEHGAKVVSEVVRRITDVERQSAQLKNDMVQLGQQAEAIGAIMNVISDIADQTNLLALNAAIEAARAGEAGRGFAVVADEVRKLAEKTMTATVEVGNAIRGVQQSAEKNMQSVDHSSRSIGEATELVRQAGASLQEIVNLVEASADQVRAIATAAEEQSATSDEINRSLGTINTTSSETARAMAEAAQAVTELSQQAQNLAKLIDEMKQL